MLTSVSAEGILTSNHTDLAKSFSSFSGYNKTAYKDEHFKFVYACLPTELAENWQVCSLLPPSKKSAGLCLISLPFQSYGLFSGRKHPRSEYQTLGGCRKKNQTTSEKSQKPFWRVMCEKTFPTLIAPLR